MFIPAQPTVYATTETCCLVDPVSCVSRLLSSPCGFYLVPNIFLSYGMVQAVIGISRNVRLCNLLMSFSLDYRIAMTSFKVF